MADLAHILVIPHPLQGHITPCLQLSRKLASSYGLSVTFVVTEHAFHRMSSPKSLSDLPITIVPLPDGLPSDHPRQSTFLDAYEAVVAMETVVENFMQQLADQGRSPSFVIADTFVFWAHELARRFGIPSVAFATTNITALSIMSSASKLVNLGVLPLKHVNGSSKYSDEPITCIPGVPPLLPKDLPQSLRSPSLTHYRLKYMIEQFKQARKAAAILVNSVYEIEKSALDCIEIPVPVYAIGPTLILNGDVKETDASMWPEDDDCLLWLDKQAAGSVLYVSFGSIASLDAIQVCELALGLEASQQPFLWVIRPGSFEGSIADLLPEGFLDRTKDRGTIISWAPQLCVLSHSATGAFLTHCGWNSVVENLCLGGLPMICWPDAAEQAVNARVIIDVWNVGIEVFKEEDGRVKRGEVERAVRAVMQEGGEKLQQKAFEMRDTVRNAVQEGGSSLRNIERCLETIRSPQK